MTQTHLRLARAHLAGFLVPSTIALQVLGIIGPLVPDRIQAFAVIARMTDSLAPYLLIASLLSCLLMAVIAYRRTALLLATLALAGLIGQGFSYARMRGPAGTETDLTVLWFNMLHSNETPPDQLVSAIRSSRADVVMLAEALPLQDVLDRLSGTYPYRLGCAALCNVLVLSQRPLRNAQIAGFETIGAERLLTITLEPEADKQPVTLVAAHLLKPWYLGFVGAERDRLHWVLQRYDGPLIVAGDFNAAPWSRRMREIRRDQSLEFPRWPVPTWPAMAGAAGVPIDHVLVRGGPRITTLTPWGAELGSNHRGLLATIDLP